MRMASPSTCGLGRYVMGLMSGDSCFCCGSTFEQTPTPAQSGRLTCRVCGAEVEAVGAAFLPYRARLSAAA